MGYLVDAIEPSVSWTNCWPLIQKVQNAWIEETKQRNLLNLFAVRISQVYHAGACVYFYFGIGPTKDRDQLETMQEVTIIIREAIKTAGGSLSHHHGIGKKNVKEYPEAMSKVAVDMFKAIKAKLDPNDVFDSGNIVENQKHAKL
jgi:alkyldihydroxyacetonephosphate synthase